MCTGKGDQTYPVDLVQFATSWVPNMDDGIIQLRFGRSSLPASEPIADNFTIDHLACHIAYKGASNGLALDYLTSSCQAFITYDFVIVQAGTGAAFLSRLSHNVFPAKQERTREDTTIRSGCTSKAPGGPTSRAVLVSSRHGCEPHSSLCRWSETEIIERYNK